MVSISFDQAMFVSNLESLNDGIVISIIDGDSQEPNLVNFTYEFVAFSENLGDIQISYGNTNVIS